MPQLVAAIATGLVVAGSYIGSTMLIRIGLAVLLNVVTSKLFGPKIPDSLESLSGISVTRRSAVEYHKIVYGQAIVSGPMIYNNVEGTNREYIWTAVALCDGEIEELVSVYLDGDAIPAAQINWAPGLGGADGAGTGDVSTVKFIGDNSTTAVNIFYTLGHPDQLSLTKMTSVFSEWTTAHRARGVALLFVRLFYNEKTEKIWQTGAPTNYRAVVKGRKIYDPRLDSTNGGSGAHRYTDDSTWEWSDNPALCLADYLVNYMNVAAATGINWTSFADAADDCDVTVSVAPVASPENTETRFTCNGALSMGASHKDNLDNILSSFDGKLVYVEGQWRVRASVWGVAAGDVEHALWRGAVEPAESAASGNQYKAWRGAQEPAASSLVSFDESDFAGGLEVRGSSPTSERFNSVRGVFIDPDRGYEPTEFPHITNSTYLTRDNSREIMYDLELPMTNSATMAQRIAFRLLEQADNQIVCKATLNARGAKVTVGDVVELSIDRLSWSSKYFRVIEWQRNDPGTFDVTFREDFAASYTDPLVADYIDGNSANVTVPTEVVPPPTGLSASAVPYGIRLNWSNPATNEFDYIDIYASTDSAWSNATRIASVRTDTYTHNVGSSTTRYYWLRARRNNGEVSARLPDSDTSTVTATSGAGTDSVNVVGAMLSDVQVTATTEVGYRLTSGGLEQSYEGVPPSPIVWDDLLTWLLSGAAGDYYVELTKSSGTDPTSGPALATRHQLNTTRTWIWTDSTQDDNAVTFEGTVTLYDNASPQVALSSASLTVEINSQAPTVTLSGTSGSPIPSSQLAISPATAQAGWRVNSDGTIQRLLAGTWTTYASGVEWSSDTPVSTYYIRATNDSGSNPSAGTLGTWQAITTTRTWTWTRSVVGTLAGTIKLEIATDAAGTNIVATGYYSGSASVE